MRSESRPKCASVPRPGVASLAQHAEAVRVVDEEPGVVRFGELEQPRQRGQVAIHAEYRVGADELPPRAAGREPRGKVADVGVRIADEFGARQERRVVQTRVVEPVAEHRVLAAGQRGDDAQVRHVTGREQERARAGAGRDPGRQLALERVVRQEMAGDQVRGPGADAMARRALLRGGDDACGWPARPR